MCIISKSKGKGCNIMNRSNFIKKNRILVLLIFLMVFALYSTNSITDHTFKSLRIKKIEETRYNIDNLLNINAVSNTTHHMMENVDDQALDNLALKMLFDMIKNMKMLFIKLIILLSLYQFCRYIKRWFILVYQLKIKFFIMRYLERKDGKKNAKSFQFSF